MFDGITKFEVQVKPEDLDELNHVNNVVYMRWLEMAARAGSANAGWPTERYFREGLGAWVVRKHWIEYLRDCKLGDIIEVYTWVQEFSVSTSLRRYAMKVNGKLCCVAATEWVYIDLKTRRASELPEQVESCFRIVPADDPRLKELGIARPVRYLPTAMRTTHGA